MTQLEPGKRYRWTVEGTVYGSEAKIDLPYGFTVSEPELLPDPLPTTPNSVVLDKNDVAWQLQGHDWCAAGDDYRYHAGDIPRGDVTVLFDAGAPRD